MKKTTLGIILLAVILATMVGCSSQSTSSRSSSVAQDNATPPTLEPIKGVDATATDPETGESVNLAEETASSYIKPYDADPAHLAYEQAFQEANERWPWAERVPKARYASLAADCADAYLSGGENWLPSQHSGLMAEIVAELDQSQVEILALKDSGQNSSRLDPYNLGHAEASGGKNDTSDAGDILNPPPLD